MSDRLPGVVENFASRIAVTWFRAAAAEPLTFEFTLGPSQTIPEGTSGWTTMQGRGWWMFVPDKPGNWPERCAVSKAALLITDEFRQATYVLPDCYWEKFAGGSDE